VNLVNLVNPVVSQVSFAGWKTAGALLIAIRP
jgi:hypothetical protein